MNVSIIGSGNVATVLSKLIRRSGHDIIEIISRNQVTGRELAQKIGCNFNANIYSINERSSLVVCCISDLGIKKIASELNYGRVLTVHTAGAVKKDILLGVSTNYGVLYPLQSLRKEMENIPAIPFLVDANNDEALTLLEDFAADLSDNVQRAGDEERLKLHLAAVITSNFTNHLYTIAEDYCSREGVDFRLLLPLIKETANRLDDYSPKDVQTGPAVRGDQATIDLHLSLINKYPELKKLYQILSDSISAIGNLQ